MGDVGSGGWWRGRPGVGHLVRGVGAVAVLTGLYYVAPLDYGFGAVTVVALLVGLAVFGWVVALQVLAIARSAHPRLRALEALATAVPLFLLLFSATYFLLSRERPEAFSEALDRTDALYFTMTVFATVGFGDIVPTTTGSRALTTVQMGADLIVVGLVVKVLFGAVEVGLSRRRRSEP
ncbi:potassium channel family protein [Streptomyces sp. RerS4]|uniref:potassium channel family protein n=1 Tax=Streptomyces sp. RerS4 TaxID=2942449 RepID=UPI00201BE271|nr:potassium channel family protein [Streptomyces sp. RerS4]UQX01782.1 potassium channel family protein [Streptomyces sp. RerS4]